MITNGRPDARQKPTAYARADTPAKDDEVGVEQTDEVGDGSSKQIGGGRDDAPGSSVPRRRRCQDILGSATSPSSRDGGAGDDGLQRRHPWAAATASAAVTTTQPSDCSGEAVAPAIDTAVTDDSATDAGTDDEHDDVVDAPRGPNPVLSGSGRLTVVLQHGRYREFMLEPLCERHVPPAAYVRRPRHDPASAINDGRHSHSDPQDVNTVRCPGRDVDNLADYFISAPRIGLHIEAPAQKPGRIDKTGRDLCAADIDGECTSRGAHDP
jgi:hypothetical protein